MQKRKLVIVGDSAFAEIAHEYFSFDSDFEVVAFAVEREFRHREKLNGLPILELEELSQQYSPREHSVFVAITYLEMSTVRARLVRQLKGQGYDLASYVSSKAFVASSAEIGEHCFIFENNTIQPFVKVGFNTVLWSGNHIGHHSDIGENCFISSHVVVSGFCSIGRNSFLGVNCTLANNVKLGAFNWLSPAVTIMKDTVEGAMFKAEKPKQLDKTTYEFFGVSEG